MVAAVLLPTAAAADITGAVRVIDGDSLQVGEHRIRIHGIDAPEMKQNCRWPKRIISCGVIAKGAMQDLVAGAHVRCKQKDTDRYGRVIATCSADGYDIGANMVHTGWALAYRRYSKQYVTIEEKAKVAKRGMWRGEFVPPWNWRRGERLDASAAKTTTQSPSLDQAQPRVCCKTCQKGKACGNSCISRRYTCRKPPGCACNAN
jgi:endonuclease YncB( thermonuclease family)